MTATVHHIRSVEPDPAAELHAERERLGQELQRLGVVDTRLAEADGKLAEVDQARAALDRADREAVEIWAAGAGEGDAPAPRLAERRQLLARRLDLQAEAEAARVAVAAVEAKRTNVIAQMNAVGVRIRERQLAAVLDEGRRVHAEAEALAADLAGKLQRIMGLRQAIVTMMTAAGGRQDADQGRLFNAALSEVDALKRPDMLADQATVDAHAAQWLEKIR